MTNSLHWLQSLKQLICLVLRTTSLIENNLFSSVTKSSEAAITVLIKTIRYTNAVAEFFQSLHVHGKLYFKFTQWKRLESQDF